MPSNDAAFKRSGAPRLLGATVAWFGALLTAALVSGLFDGGLPEHTWAEAAAPVALAAGGGPAGPSMQGMCFDGPGGELLDFAPAGQHCR